MISICQTLVPNIPKYFHDSEKMTLIMTPIIVNLITPNFKSPLRNYLMGQISAYCFDMALKYNLNSTKTWKRDLWDAFFDNSFLWMPRYYFSVLSNAFNVVTQDSERFSEVLGKSMFSVYFFILHYSKIFNVCNGVNVSLERCRNIKQSSKH